MGGTFGDWIQKAREHGITLDITLKRIEDQERLDSCGLPRLTYEFFDEEDINGMLRFRRRFGNIVVILYSKTGELGQPWDLFGKFEDVIGFLLKYEPLSRFNIRFGEAMGDDGYGGTIISDGSNLTIELARGIQSNLAHGKDKNGNPVEVYTGQASFENLPLRYSTNCSEKIKRMMSQAVSFIKTGDDFIPGYFEFFYGREGVKFIDYKTDPKFFKK